MQRENPPPSELDPVSLLSDLIAPESANPGLAPGRTGERGVADFRARWLARHGFEVHRLVNRSARVRQNSATWRGEFGV